MFAGCSDECIKAIIKAKQGKGAHPYTNPHNLRSIPKRPINLQIKEPISIKPTQKFVITPSVIESKKKPIITELNQEKSICAKLEPVKKTTDTELDNDESNKNINPELDREEISDTELDREESNEKQSISNELEVDTPKTWYNISIFSKHFT